MRIKVNKQMNTFKFKTLINKFTLIYMTLKCNFF